MLLSLRVGLPVLEALNFTFGFAQKGPEARAPGLFAFTGLTRAPPWMTHMTQEKKSPWFDSFRAPWHWWPYLFWLR